MDENKEESRTNLVCATIEYQPYESRKLTPEKIELIRKMANARFNEEELKAVSNKISEILYRRNDITDYCKMVDLTEE